MCREMFEGTGPRGLSSSDLTNVSQVTGELLLDLDKLPGHSSNEDRLQRCKEGIRTRKYLGKKLLPSH